jgi:hypothetical protein
MTTRKCGFYENFTPVLYDKIITDLVPKQIFKNGMQTKTHETYTSRKKI